MREIKFRIWDEKVKLMVPDAVIYDNENACIPDVTVNKIYGDRIDEREWNGDVPEWYLLTGNIQVMQFTGLLDKNEKEIYEGDILKHRQFQQHDTIPNEEKENTGMDVYGVVKYYQGSFYIDCHNALFTTIYIHAINIHGFVFKTWSNGFYDAFEGAGKFEIIGNIYENPELLK